MGNTAIQVDHLSKQYRIGSLQQGGSTYKSLREELTKAVRAPIRRAGRLLRGEPYGAAGLDETIWALKDVSFEIEHGEAVGIIGPNGAGKTTLLKILSRITEPTEGRAVLHGRVGSLLEVGTGFHPELTGRENIYLNGAILGMTKTEIEQRFDEIVAFSGVEQFIDTPVKHYSSGMRVRLAFSVAAHLEPEILLIDEVLAVGDASFQKRCLGKMGKVAEQGRTVLFVSHNMGAVNRLCKRSLLLAGGQVLMQGRSQEIVSEYLASGISSTGRCAWEPGKAEPGVVEFELDSIRVFNENRETTSDVGVNRPFGVEIRYRIKKALPFCRVGFWLRASDGTTVFEAYDADDKRCSGKRSPGDYVARCKVPGDLLNCGKYTLSVNAGMPNIKKLAFVEGALVVNVEDTGAVGSHLHSKRRGIIRPELEWECQKAEEVEISTAGDASTVCEVRTSRVS